MPIPTAYGVRRLSRSRLCRIFSISRSAFYRGYSTREKSEDAAIESAIREVRAKHRRYGYRPIAKALRAGKFRYRGSIINRKRILRIMRAKRLLCTLPRRRPWRKPKSDPAPYPNLPTTVTPSVPNQLWIADFTEISVQSRRTFIAVVVDAFSRRCIGWAVGSNHNEELTSAALQMALLQRRPKPGFIHHSDQGSEYMAYEYTALVEKHGGIVSASRKGTPTDNPACERFIKTLKYEELLDHEFTGIEEVRVVMSAYVVLYNESRLHSALDYRTPAHFERTYHAARKSQP